MRGKAGRIGGHWLLVGAALLLATSCGRSGPRLAPLLPTAADTGQESAGDLTQVTPFCLPGEKVTWKVLFLGFEVGRARFAVGDPGRTEEGRWQVELLGEGEASGISRALLHASDIIHTWVDVESGVPTRSESSFDLRIQVRNVEKRIDVVATRDLEGERVQLEVWKPAAGNYSINQRLPSKQTLDPLSTLLYLRGWSAKNGERRNVYTLGGTRLWQTDLIVQAHEMIETQLGRFPAIRLAGISRRMTHHSLTVDKNRQPRTFTVWISEDRERVPLRIVGTTEYGEVSLEVTSYAAPITAQR